MTIVENLAYGGAAAGPRLRRQSLDLYLPEAPKENPPLLIFVHGGFWSQSDDDFGIGPSLANELAVRGVAVALVRYRLGPENKHPAQAQDVAAAVGYLLGHSDRYGFDRRRVYLGGHSAGAHLVSLIALDGLYLGEHGISPADLAGVIGFSGIYNLIDRDELSIDERKAITNVFGDDRAALEKASPASHIKPGAPPFLLLSASGDLFGFNVDTRRFSDALNSLGDQTTTPVIVSGRDHISLLQLGGPDNMARDLVMNFLNVEPLPPGLKSLMQARRDWLKAAPSTLEFWKYEHLIRSYPLDQALMQLIIGHYGSEKHELVHWSFEKFHAMDLLALLDLLPEEEIGKGDYLVLTNLRNEKVVWNTKEIAPYSPVVVVGIDDEKNLFRIGGFYRMRREYSWKGGERLPAMVRPVGAFIHFLKPTPPDLMPKAWHFAMTIQSLRLVPKNPFDPVKQSLPKPIYDVMTFENGCIYCHKFRGVGSRSHHIRAEGGAAHGGFALPLEEYPPEVWKAFVFQQEAVARGMGAIPNLVEPPLREPLYELVVQSRERRKGSVIFRQ